MQQALIQAIKRTHPPWGQITDEVLSAISEELRNYKWVFSTNYDLLIYWAIVGQPKTFVDYFWAESGQFDLHNTECGEILHGFSISMAHSIFRPIPVATVLRRSQNRMVICLIHLSIWM